MIERARFESVDFDALPWDELMKLVDEASRKRKAKYEKGLAKQKTHPSSPKKVQR